MKPKGKAYLVSNGQLGAVPYGPSHTETIAKWLSSDPFELFLTSSSLSFPVLPEAFHEYYEGSTREPGAHDFLEVYHMASGQHIGHFELKGVSARHRSGTIAHVLLGAQEFRSRGLGKDLCELMVRYGFEHRKLFRLSVSVHTCNHRAITAYVHGGFVFEGIVRDVVEYEGKRFSLYQMSLLRSEWNPGNPIA